MGLSLNIPVEAESVLLDAWGSGLDRAALEALAIEGYRSGKFGTAQVRKLLSLPSRWDAERWLASRGIHLNYALEDLEADRRTLERILGKTA